MKPKEYIKCGKNSEIKCFKMKLENNIYTIAFTLKAIYSFAVSNNENEIESEIMKLFHNARITKLSLKEEKFLKKLIIKK